MLMQVHITNLITIEKLSLDFSSGTTVITGETGTGKSILIDAIELALGARASEHVIRPGQEKADISLCFDVSKLPDARTWLKNYDLEQTDSECIIRRSISKDGRSRTFINNMPTTLQPLRELSELLINIHGQHEQQTLLKPEKQRDLLDRYAGHQHLVDRVLVLANEWRVLHDKISALRKAAEDRSARSEYLKFQLDEFENLQLTPNEFEALDLEHKQLANADELLQNVNDALNHLAENEAENVLSLLNHALQSLETIQRVEPKVIPWIENLRNAIIQVSDTEDELRRYNDSIDLDPSRLESVEQRISLLFNLARKHKISPNDLYEFQAKLTREFKELANSDELLQELQRELFEIEKKYTTEGTQLSQSRAKAAKKLEKEITKTIRELALPHADFHIQLEAEKNPEPTSHGLEKIIFQIRTNAGQTMQPLAKIVSGGELSRIGLAIHIATAEKHTIPALIFDEVDVGISGGTAEIVGKLLRHLGESHQVLCITHLPQVAAQGHHHIKVDKVNRNNMTFSHIQHLVGAEKVQEIARMLGGVEITKTTLAHAKEMIESVI